MALLTLTVELRLENSQVGNTWFSRGTHDDNDLQIHCSQEMWIALGKPKNILVEITPDES